MRGRSRRGRRSAGRGGLATFLLLLGLFGAGVLPAQTPAPTSPQTAVPPRSAATASPGLPAIFLVHLPSLPVEAGQRVAEAVTALADAVAGGVPGLSLEVQLFRRLEDARALYASQPDRVAFILAEPPCLEILPQPGRFDPRYRFVREGRETYRRHLVVPANRVEWTDISALSGHTLSFVEITGKTEEERAAFLGTLLPPGSAAAKDPRTFFRLVSTLDDFSAAANVIFQQSDAALVAEHNPLFRSHRAELRILHTTQPLSLPVLAVARDALDASQLRALDGVMASLRPGAGEASREALAALKLDGMAVVSPMERLALLHGEEPAHREPEIALPPGGDAPLPPLAAVDPALLSFGLAVELPEVPILPTPTPGRGIASSP